MDLNTMQWGMTLKTTLQLLKIFYKLYINKINNTDYLPNENIVRDRYISNVFVAKAINKNAGTRTRMPC